MSKTTQDGADVVERPSPITPYCESDDDHIFALLCARKAARSEHEAAAIAWAEDEITRLRSENEHLREALREMAYFRRDDSTWRCACFADHEVPEKVRAVLQENSNG